MYRQRRFSKMPLSAFPPRSQSCGFTLIETLVAISILVTSIIVPMTIAAKGLQSAYYAKEQLTATFLAQEGIEFMRLQRDSLALVNQNTNTDDWYNVLSNNFNVCKTPNGCGVDMYMIDAPRNTIACGGPDSSACVLRYDGDISNLSSERGMYNYLTGDMTQFKRAVFLDAPVTTNEVVVRVEVSWNSNLFSSAPRKVILQSRLFNQYNDY